METRIQKWGNSLALRIPGAFARQARIHSGSRVDVSQDNGKLVITLLPDDEPTLELLLAGITPENTHQEISSGVAVGNEAW